MDKRRFDRLVVKLFLAIAGAIAALTLAAYYVFTTSFERGFVAYLQRADESRIEVLIDRLEDGYARERSWVWLANDRDRWIELTREALGLPRSSSAGAGVRRQTPLTIDPRLMLFDGDRKPLIARTEAVANAVLKPVVVDGVTVGYLGYVPRPDIIASIENVYLERQRVAFASIAVAMIVAALALGAGLAYWLARRIRVLARATGRLIEGDYDARVPARGNDELAQLARDLNTLAATLAQTRDARQQWIADIAHELRTPLSVLRGEIESLEDGVRPLDRNAIASLSSETARLARLVEDLHTLSLSDLGALSYYKEPIELAETIEDALDAQRRALEDKGLRVETTLDPGLRVYADETRLAQVFANLIQNNLRYSKAPGTIAIRAERRNGRAAVTWEDSGPGVAAEDLPRLTDRLFRVESSRSRSGGGSGLGLAIAKAIVQAHGGTLALATSERGGLAVEISLPLNPERTEHG